MRDLSPKVVLRCSLSKFGINTLQQCGNNTLVLLDMPPCKWTFQTIMNGSSANFLRTFSKRNQSFYFFIYWYLVLDMDIGIWYLTWIFLRIWPGYPDDQSESQRGDKGSLSWLVQPALKSAPFNITQALPGGQMLNLVLQICQSVLPVQQLHLQLSVISLFGLQC